MNCTQCGAPLQRGQRFCTSCGAAVDEAPARPEPKPELDLSAYFDAAPEETAAQYPEPEQESFAYAPQEIRRPAARRRPAAEPEVRAQKSDRGLNIALLICGMLAVAVVTFVVILLLSNRGGGESGGTQRPQGDTVPVVETAQPIGIPDPDVTASPVAPTAAPVSVITPSPLPTTAPTATPSPAPTPAPEYLLPESNTRYLTESDLSGLTHEELCFARNEIFARHGRIFQTPEIAAYFNGKSWYHGTVSAANFSDSVFNAYERSNISFIRDYENKYYGGSYY